MSRKAILYRMHTSDHLCPYGLKSRDLLRREGYEVEDHELTTRAETNAFKQQYDVKTTPQTFIADERVGGYDDLKAFFGKADNDDKSTTYGPIIAIFAMTFLMAVALAFRAEPVVGVISVVEVFIALSMCVLAIQKLRDIGAFSLQFIVYDLIAMRRPQYAYVYAYLEAFAGVGMLMMLPAWLVSPPAAFIGTVGAISVIKAVYIDRRELKCACVGGNSNVPLGFVSLTENLLMIAMAIWMWVR